MKKTLLVILFSFSIFSNVFAQASDLFFSEYIEGSSNNKALEIYNGTGATVNLSDYLIVQSTNGGGWQYYHVFPDTAILESGKTWVMASSSIPDTLFDLTKANEVLSYPDLVFFNGDDARGLMKINGLDTVLIDVIGVPDVDPGTAWEVAGVSNATQNHTLVRKPTVTGGNTDWASAAGTDSLSSEWLVYSQNNFSHLGSHTISIAMARGMIDDTVTISAVTISPNYQTTGRSYYIWDGTGGLATYIFGLTSPALKLGDQVIITGKVTSYNGLIEINPLTDTSIVVVDSNAVLPEPEIITVAQYKSNPENYESHLIGIQGVTLTSGTWPTTKSNASIYLEDSNNDTLTVFLDSDMGLYNETEPSWPVDLVGIGSQYSSSGVGGYQILPRFITDFMPDGSLPVELTSFAANTNDGTVSLTWTTATETNNSGFEIQRSVNGKNFNKIGFVRGQGNTPEKSNYSFTDKPAGPSTYFYRLKQIDFSGSFSFSDVVKINMLAPNSFALLQNYPNPFNPTTSISFTLSVDSKVSLKVFNVLGQEVASLLNSTISAGQHQITFNASNLNSGVYFYQIKVNGIDGSTYNAVRKMMLTK